MKNATSSMPSTMTLEELLAPDPDQSKSSDESMVDNLSGSDTSDEE